MVTWHYHLSAFWKSNLTSYVERTEVELRTVVVVEWSVTTTFFFLQYVDLSLELSVWSDCAWFCKHHTTTYFRFLNTTEEKTYVVTCFTLIKELAEHLDTCTSRLLTCFCRKTDELELVAYVYNTCLYTARSNCTTTCDSEDVLNWHKEWLVSVAWRQWNPLVYSVHKFHYLIFPSCFTVECTKCRTTDNWRVVTVEFVEAEQVAKFHLNEVEKFCVVNHVHFVHENNDSWNVHLTSQKDVLASLRHRTVSCSTNKDSTVHLSCTCYHVLHIVGVTRTVYVCVVTFFSLVLYVCCVDGDTTFFFFWSIVDRVECLLLCKTLLCKYCSDSCSKGSFTMVNVANCTYVNVWFGSFE